MQARRGTGFGATYAEQGPRGRCPTFYPVALPGAASYHFTLSQFPLLASSVSSNYT